VAPLSALSAQEQRAARLAAIRAQREEQAAKNRELAAERKRKIEEINAGWAVRPAPPRPSPMMGAQMEAMRAQIAAQEAQLAALRRRHEGASAARAPAAAEASAAPAPNGAAAPAPAPAAAAGGDIDATTT
jgi:hypothetical protein